MKKLPIAAAALLIGTSAYAMVPADGTAKDYYTVEPTMAVDQGYFDETPALQPAAADSWSSAKPVAYAPDPGYKTVVASGDEVKAAQLAKADAQFDAATEADWNAAAKAKMDSAALDGSATWQPATYETGFGADESAPAFKPASAETGFADDDSLGGDSADMDVAAPQENMEVAAADLSPRPAAGNYPACHPGPGDDRCIQLYEPGVRAELASWSQPTGGFAGSADTQVAMGGPYEPVDSAVTTEELNQQALADSERALQLAQAAAADETGTEVAMADSYDAADDAAMSGDGEVDTALGETPEDEVEV